MTIRSGSASIRITVSDVSNGTPESATTGGTNGLPPAAMTTRSAVISSAPEPSVSLDRQRPLRR